MVNPTSVHPYLVSRLIRRAWCEAVIKLATKLRFFLSTSSRSATCKPHTPSLRYVGSSIFIRHCYDGPSANTKLASWQSERREQCAAWAERSTAKLDQRETTGSRCSLGRNPTTSSRGGRCQPSQHVPKAPQKQQADFPHAWRQQQAEQ